MIERECRQRREFPMWRRRSRCSVALPPRRDRRVHRVLARLRWRPQRRRRSSGRGALLSVPPRTHPRPFNGQRSLVRFGGCIRLRGFAQTIILTALLGFPCGFWFFSSPGPVRHPSSLLRFVAPQDPEPCIALSSEAAAGGEVV